METIVPQLECKSNHDDKESKCSHFSELGSCSNSNCSSADGEQKSLSHEPFGMVLSSSKEGADDGKKDMEDADPRMDVDSDEDNEVDEEEIKLDKDGNSQPIKASKAEEKVSQTQ